jgi:hypothetical protein
MAEMSGEDEAVNIAEILEVVVRTDHPFCRFIRSGAINLAKHTHTYPPITFWTVA